MKNFRVWAAVHAGDGDLITLTGMTTPIGMGAGWNILGVTERLSIYSVQTMLFGLSAYYTFSPKGNAKISCKASYSKAPPAHLNRRRMLFICIR